MTQLYHATPQQGNTKPRIAIPLQSIIKLCSATAQHNLTMHLQYSKIRNLAELLLSITTPYFTFTKRRIAPSRFTPAKLHTTTQNFCITTNNNALLLQRYVQVNIANTAL